VEEVVADRVLANAEAAVAVREFVEGLRLYFDRALPTLLLYRFERAQFEEYVLTRPEGDRRPLSEVYGAEHLLRLLVKLPDILASAALPAEDSRILDARVRELVRFLNVNLPRYFRNDYVDPPIAYVQDFERAVSQWTEAASADLAAVAEE
jgi:mortality factor 4-like protein 1